MDILYRSTAERLWIPDLVAAASLWYVDVAAGEHNRRKSRREERCTKFPLGSWEQERYMEQAVPPFTRFTSVPRGDHSFVREFFHHIATTQSPETFPGLHPGPFGSGERFQIVQPFEIDPARRAGGERAYCPRCRHRNKYTKGSLVFFPDRGVLGAVGNECADAKASAGTDADYRVRRDAALHYDFLWDNLGRVPHWLALVREAEPVVAEAQRVFRIIRREGGDWLRALKGAERSGGLIIHEVINSQSAVRGLGLRGSGGNETREVFNAGPLLGRTALSHDFKPVNALESIRRMLQQEDFGADTEQILDALARMEREPSEMRRAFVNLTVANRQWGRLRQSMADFVEFFDASNLDRIHAWSIHRANNLSCSVGIEHEWHHRVFCVSRRGKRIVRAILDPVLWTSIPPWD